MAWLLFEDRDTYLETIESLIGEADIDTLDKICRLLIKHYWPSAYVK